MQKKKMFFTLSKTMILLHTGLTNVGGTSTPGEACLR